jgi:hypothetical protein
VIFKIAAGQLDSKQTAKMIRDHRIALNHQLSGMKLLTTVSDLEPFVWSQADAGK